MWSLSKRILAVAAAVLVVGPVVPGAWAKPAPPATQESASRGLAQLRDLQEAFASIAEKVAPTVVAIQARRKLSSIEELNEGHDELLRRFGERLVPSVGSGIIIDSTGYILTNEHVVAAAEDLTVVLADRHRFPAKIIGADPRSDLAVIKIESKDLPVAMLGDVSTVRQGHWAVAMGNAFGLAAEGKPAMTVGVVSAIGRALPNLGAGDRHYGNLIQTSADINPGSSGGPLLNLEGQVVGVNTAISSRTGVSEGVGFAVPMTAQIRRIIDDLKAGRKIEYGFLGVVVRSPLPEESARAGAPSYVGAVVDFVEPETPAAKANIRPGDVIVQIDGEQVADSDHLVRAIGSSPIGRAVDVVLWRDKKKVAVAVVLEKRGEVLARRKPEPDSLQWRGLTVGPLSEGRRKALGLARDAGGVEILAVQESSPAHAAGLKVGDVIDRLDDKPVKTLDDFRRLADAVGQAKDAVLHLVKGGTKTVKPGTGG